ncbi:MAG: hypothetical protein ACUVUC_13480 [Thermoguttaceae bacterium]
MEALVRDRLLGRLGRLVPDGSLLQGLVLRKWALRRGPSRDILRERKLQPVFVFRFRGPDGLLRGALDPRLAGLGLARCGLFG